MRSRRRKPVPLRPASRSPADANHRPRASASARGFPRKTIREEDQAFVQLSSPGRRRPPALFSSILKNADARREAGHAAFKCGPGLSGRQGLVRAVAGRLLAGALASAEEYPPGLVGGVLHRRKGRAFVAAVAERLLRRLTARAPVVVLAGFDIDRQRRTAANVGHFAHEAPPPSVCNQASPHAFASSRTRKM